MREEQVTKFILKWLLDTNWEIVCFDFPQSGTGHFLHPNGSTDKNKDTINPDIVAVKDKYCLFLKIRIDTIILILKSKISSKSIIIILMTSIGCYPNTLLKKFFMASDCQPKNMENVQIRF